LAKIAAEKGIIKDGGKKISMAFLARLDEGCGGRPGNATMIGLNMIECKDGLFIRPAALEKSTFLSAHCIR
jgi:hypothetical protein